MAIKVYGSIARVESLVGDLVPSRTFGDDTVPSSGEVEQFLEERASQLTMALRKAGYTVPVTDQETSKWLELINSTGAAILVMGSYPLGGYADPSFDSPSMGRRHSLEKEWKDAFKLIDSGALPAEKTLTKMHQAKVGQSTTSTEPYFKRGMLKNPEATAETA